MIASSWQNIDTVALASHREMLLENYRCELRRMAEKVEAAQSRLEVALDPRAADLKRKISPTSDHDGYAMQQCAADLIKTANQLTMLETIIRSVKE
jgi:hypothetical protein